MSIYRNSFRITKYYKYKKTTNLFFFYIFHPIKLSNYISILSSKKADLISPASYSFTFVLFNR